MDGPISEDEIAARAEITRVVPDMLGTRFIIEPDECADAVAAALGAFEERASVALEHVGNWWVKGNPYKGINSVFLVTEGDGAGWLRFEVQFHTPESGELAQRNHDLYKILRNPQRPVRERQHAYDTMAARFDAVRHPPGIDVIGEPVVRKRPVGIVEGHTRAEADTRDEIANLFSELGLSISIIEREYPDELKHLLDTGLTQLDDGDPGGALDTFDRAIALYADDEDVWATRGVALALLRSGYTLTRLGRFADALARFDSVLEMKRKDDYRYREIGAIGYQARTLRQQTLDRMEAARRMPELIRRTELILAIVRRHGGYSDSSA